MWQRKHLGQKYRATAFSTTLSSLSHVPIIEYAEALVWNVVLPWSICWLQRSGLTPEPALTQVSRRLFWMHFRIWIALTFSTSVNWRLLSQNFWPLLAFVVLLLLPKNHSLVSHRTVILCFLLSGDVSQHFLYFLTSFCYSRREGKMDLVTDRDSLKCMPMIHIFPFIQSNISLAIIPYFELIREQQLWSYWHLAPFQPTLHTGTIQFSDISTLPCPACICKCSLLNQKKKKQL